MEVLTRALAISDQRGKNFPSLQPASASARTKIPAPGARVIRKSSNFLVLSYRIRLLEYPFGEKLQGIIAKLPTAALAAAIKVPNFYPASLPLPSGQKKNSRTFRHGSLSNFYLLVITFLQGAPSG